MSTFQLVIMGIYALSAFVLMERRDNRGLGWVCMAASVYLLTTSYWRAGYPEPALFSSVMDGAACVAIYLFGKYSWEMLIWRFFQFFILVNMIRLAGVHLPIFPEFSGWIYSSALEAGNVLIALTALAGPRPKGAEDDDMDIDRARNRFSGFVCSLRQKRKEPPFWKVSE